MTNAPPLGNEPPSLPPPDSRSAQRAEDDLTVEIDAIYGGFLVKMTGAIRVDNLGLLEQLLQLLPSQPRIVVLDCGGLTVLSGPGIELLAHLGRELACWGGRLRFTRMPPRIHESLEVARLADRFPFHATVADALLAD